MYLSFVPPSLLSTYVFMFISLSPNTHQVPRPFYTQLRFPSRDPSLAPYPPASVAGHNLVTLCHLLILHRGPSCFHLICIPLKPGKTAASPVCISTLLHLFLVEEARWTKSGSRDHSKEETRSKLASHNFLKEEVLGL